MNYESSVDTFGSDHRPVFAQFYVDLTQKNGEGMGG